MANNLHHIVSVMPRVIPFQTLKEITDNFSEHRKIGHGGCAEVYKGIYNGEEIVVKKLHLLPWLGGDKQFNNELLSLVRIQHQNIVKLVGYCCGTQHELIEHNGRFIFADREQRVLCFEYFPLGSLDKHLFDESRLDWHTSYKIIVGICVGLNFLHNGSKDPVYHLDLKPQNILLDESMTPKICDFGLSRLIESTKSHNTENKIGTYPFMPPEYVQKGTISDKYDVFSLGVTIIQIIAGPKGYNKFRDMSPQEFTELVHMRGRIEGTSKHVEEYCHQVKKCITIASDCVEHDKDKRPTIRSIVNTLEPLQTIAHRTLEEEKEGEQEQLEQIETMIHSTVEEDRGQENSQVHTYGPWGGNGGTSRDIGAASSHRLKSVTIRYGDIIDSLTFSYSDHSEDLHSVGPWGGPGGAKEYTINFEPSEFLTEISGKFGPYALSPSNVITTLTLKTNEDRYGPFGFVQGTPFCTELTSGWAIVGFFARAERYVHKIGVYARPIRSTLDAEELAVNSELEGGQE